MRHLSTILPIVLHRAAASWRLLATVIVGVVLSAALMSTVVLYSDTVRDLGLQHALAVEDPFDLDIRVLSSTQRLNPGEYDTIQDAYSVHTAALEASITEDTARFVRSATFFPTTTGGVVQDDDPLRPRAHFQAATDLKDHIELLEGRFPDPALPTGDPSIPPTVEVLLSATIAAREGLDVGTTLDLYPFWDEEAAPVEIVIVGLFEPIENDERYWGEGTKRWLGPATSWPTYSLFVPSDRVIVEAVAGYLPTIDGITEWVGLVDIDKVNSRNAASIEAQIGGMRGALHAAVARTSVTTGLDPAINTYQSKLFFTRLPLFALMLQVVGIVLYYLVMVASMLQERQTGEIALLRSRGASIYQVVGMTAIEGAVICGTAAILGPFLAIGGIAVLGLTPPFQDLSGGELLRVPLTRMAFVMAGLGAALAFVALLVPAYQAARRTMVDYKTTLARPDQQPIFLRYYLDLVLIGAAAFAFYQLRQQDSLVTERLFGDLSADPLLLISPTLFMLMVALVFVRLFPLVLRLVSVATARLRGPTVALGTWRMVRSPMQYSRLILLLLLATAVGMFAAGFRATLERSYDDRAAYEAVAGARIADVRFPLGLPTDEFTSAVQEATQANTVAPVVRLRGSYRPAIFERVDLDVVGVHPEEAAAMLFWRGDFASGSLDELLAKVKQDPGFEPTIGLPLPTDSSYVGIWVFTSQSQDRAQPWVRFRAEDGEYFDYRLSGPSEQVEDGGWQFFAADLRRLPRTRQLRQPPPLWLDSVYVRILGPPPQFPETETMLFDDLQVKSGEVDLEEVISSQEPSGWELVEDFEDQTGYELITGATIVGDPGSMSRTRGRSEDGGSAVRIIFTREEFTPQVVGLRVLEDLTLLPVVVDEGFLDEARVEEGDEIAVFVNRQYVQMKIVGTFDLFPAFDPDGREHLMVADIESLIVTASRVPFVAQEVVPLEAWLNGVSPTLNSSGLAEAGVRASIVVEQTQLRAEAGEDPLVAASWEGILFLSFFAVLALTALGFGVYAVLAARARTLEFAILRTMGYTPRQILALVSFEQAFVIGAGIVVGTLLGFPLGRLMIGYLGTTESGVSPLPPLVSDVSWTTVLTVYGLVALVFVVTVAALARTYSKIAVAQALRIGEV